MKSSLAWGLFFIGCFVFSISLGLVTYRSMELEREKEIASELADREEKIRLALWRLEIHAWSYLSQENARSFDRWPEGVLSGAYGTLRYFTWTGNDDIGIDANLLRERLAKDSGRKSSQKPFLPRDSQGATSSKVRGFQAQKHSLSSLEQNRNERDYYSKKIRVTKRGDYNAVLKQQKDWSDREFVSRFSAKNLIDQNVYYKNQGWSGPDEDAPQKKIERQSINHPQDSLQENKNFITIVDPVNIFWIKRNLVCARRVSKNGFLMIQGAVLDWETTRKDFGEQIKDILPNAQVVPANENGKDSLRLASFPIKLSVPPLYPDLETIPFIEIFHWRYLDPSLLWTWFFFIFMGLLGTFFLRGILSLSQRRADFVSAVTHELRTPLTTFSMSSGLLKRGGLDEPSQKRHLNILQRESQRLRHLVENVLAYSRIENNKEKIKLLTLTVEDLIERARDRLELRSQEAGFLFSVEKIDNDVLGTAVQVDPHAIERILFNLVDNACKYAGGGKEKNVYLSATQESSWVHIKIRDTGVGIKDPQRIFKPFSKSAKEAAVTAPGIGLGLALCRELARHLNGDLKLSSNGPKGTCFTLSLPISHNSFS